MPAPDRILAMCDLRRSNGFTPEWDATHSRDTQVTVLPEGGKRVAIGFRAERAAFGRIRDGTRAERLKNLALAGAFLVAEVYRRRGLATTGNIRARQSAIVDEMLTREASIPQMTAPELIAEARSRIDFDSIADFVNAGAVVCRLIQMAEA